MDQRNPDITAASVTKMKPQKSNSVSLETDENNIAKSEKINPIVFLVLIQELHISMLQLTW